MLRAPSSSHRPTVVAAVAASLIVSFVPMTACAEAPPIRVEHYDVPEGCPDKRALLAEISKRTPVARVATPYEDALVVWAAITKFRNWNEGHLILWKDHRAERDIVRAFEADSCEDVAAAFAFVIALAVDPHAPMQPATARPSSTASVPGPALPPRAPWFTEEPGFPPGWAEGPLDGISPGLSLPRPALVVSNDPLRHAQPTGRLPLRVGVRGAAAFGLTPLPLWGGGVFVEKPLETRWDVALRLSLEMGATGTSAVTGGGSARFLRGLARFEACVVALRLARGLAVAPCLGPEVGFLFAKGIAGGSFPDAHAVVVPWFGLSVLPRIRFDSGALFAEAQGGPVVSLVNGAFVTGSKGALDEQQPIQDIQSVTWALSAGGGFEF